jgi:hypothetical protein
MRRNEIIESVACHAWVPVAVAALQTLQEAMKQPQQGQLQKGQSGGGYQPTALAQMRPTSGDATTLSDLFKKSDQGGMNPAGNGQPSSGGLGPIGGNPGQSNGMAQTSQALGGGFGAEGFQQPSSGTANGQGSSGGGIGGGDVANIGMSLAQLLGQQQQPGGGLLRGPSAQYQPTALQQIQQHVAAMRANPYGGGY